MAGPIIVMSLNLDISMKKVWGDLHCAHIFPVAVIAMSYWILYLQRKCFTTQLRGKTKCTHIV